MIETLADVGLHGIPLWEEQQGASSSSKAKDSSTEESHWVAKDLQGVSKGQRHATLVKLMGYFRNKFPQETTLVILEGFANRCTPPIPFKELETQVTNIYKYESYEPLNVLPPGGPPCFEAMLKGVPESFRVTACFRLSVIGQRIGIEKRMMKSKLTIWDMNTNQSALGEFGIAMQLRSAYSGKFKVGCPDIEQARLCFKECPIYETRSSESDTRVSSTLTLVSTEGSIQLQNCTVSNLIKQNSDPPRYKLKINNRQVSFDSEELFRFGKFKKRCGEIANIIPILISSKESEELRWERILNELQERMVIESVPVEVNRGNEIVSSLMRYLIRTPKAKTLADFMEGRPWKDETSYFFRGPDFLEFVRNLRISNEGPGFIWQVLHELGIESGTHRIEGKPVWCWEIDIDEVEGQSVH